jgi:hypothetical protein
MRIAWCLVAALIGAVLAAPNSEAALSQAEVGFLTAVQNGGIYGTEMVLLGNGWKVCNYVRAGGHTDDEAMAILEDPEISASADKFVVAATSYLCPKDIGLIK